MKRRNVLQPGSYLPPVCRDTPQTVHMIMQPSQPQTRATDLPKTIKIRVFKNGDRHFPGAQVVVRNRNEDFDNFLDRVTTAVRSNEAIRHLYNDRGLEVEHTRDVRDGERYVASTKEGFKALDYGKIVDVRFRRAANKVVEKLPQLAPDARSRMTMGKAARYLKKVVDNKPVVFRVLKNGDTFDDGIRITFEPRRPMEWGKLMQLISDRVKLPTGAMRKLCTLEGKSVNDSSELENGEVYVAVGNERFRKVEYLKHQPDWFSGRVKPPGYEPLQLDRSVDDADFVPKIHRSKTNLGRSPKKLAPLGRRKKRGSQESGSEQSYDNDNDDNDDGDSNSYSNSNGDTSSRQGDDYDNDDDENENEEDGASSAARRRVGDAEHGGSDDDGNDDSSSHDDARGDAARHAADQDVALGSTKTNSATKSTGREVDHQGNRAETPGETRQGDDSGSDGTVYPQTGASADDQPHVQHHTRVSAGPSSSTGGASIAAQETASASSEGSTNQSNESPAHQAQEAQAGVPASSGEGDLSGGTEMAAQDSLVPAKSGREGSEADPTSTQNTAPDDKLMASSQPSSAEHAQPLSEAPPSGAQQDTGADSHNDTVATAGQNQAEDGDAGEGGAAPATATPATPAEAAAAAASSASSSATSSAAPAVTSSAAAAANSSSADGAASGVEERQQQASSGQQPHEGAANANGVILTSDGEAAAGDANPPGSGSSSSGAEDASESKDDGDGFVRLSASKARFATASPSAEDEQKRREALNRRKTSLAACIDSL